MSVLFYICFCNQHFFSNELTLQTINKKNNLLRVLKRQNNHKIIHVFCEYTGLHKYIEYNKTLQFISNESHLKAVPPGSLVGVLHCYSLR